MSPYETAAEMLSQTPLALAIDLRCLTPGDLPLVAMARQKGVEVLAVGSVPLGIATADLSGVRLSTRDHLPVLLEAIGSSTPPGDVVAAPPQPVSAATPVRPAMTRWIRTTPLSDRKSGSSGKVARSIRQPSSTRDLPPAGKQDAFGACPEDLLTSEELAALLEDDS